MESSTCNTDLNIPGLIALPRPLPEGMQEEAETYLKNYQGVLADYSWSQFICLQHCSNLYLMRDQHDLLFFRGGKGILDLILPPLHNRTWLHLEEVADKITRLIPDNYIFRIMNLDPQIWTISDHPACFTIEKDHPDYLYLREELLTMAGADYRNRRSDVNHLLRSFPDLQIEWLTEATAREALKSLDSLLSRPRGPRTNPCDFIHTTPQTTAYWDRYMAKKLLLCWNAHRARGLALRVWDKLVGLMLGVPLGNNVLSIMTGKVLPGFDGGMTLLLRRLCEEWPTPVQRINLADDGGIRGLQQMKMKLRPEFMAERYTAVLNAEAWDMRHGT